MGERGKNTGKFLLQILQRYPQYDSGELRNEMRWSWSHGNAKELKDVSKQIQLYSGLIWDSVKL